MGLFSWLSSIFDPHDAGMVNAASSTLSDYVGPNSPYWNAGKVGNDTAIQQGAAGLQNAGIGVNTANVDQDAAAFGGLQDTFANIARNGGPLGAAAQHQAASDLANTNVAALKSASEQQAAKVLSVDNAERNWAASGATQSRSQVLGNTLQKQLWNMAVSHANFEAALAGRGIQNEDQNLAQQLATSIAAGGVAGRNAQQSTARQYDQQQFSNAMAGLQGIGGAVSAATGGISGMMNAADQATGNASAGISTGYTAAPTASYEGGYAMPTPALGTTFNRAALSGPSVSTYVSPITGSTINPNLPTDTSSWGDWLSNGSTLVS